MIAALHSTEHWKCDGKMKFRRKHLLTSSQAMKDKACMSHKYSVNFDYSWRLMSFYERPIIMPFYRNGNSNNVNAVGLTQHEPKLEYASESSQKDCNRAQSSNHLE